MAQYLIYFNQQWVGDHTEEWFLGRVEPSMAVVKEMEAAGVLVFAGGLDHAAPTYSADATSGEIVVTDGPFVETKEALGGFYVVDAPDLDTITELCQLLPSTYTIEIRPVVVIEGYDYGERD